MPLADYAGAFVVLQLGRERRRKQVPGTQQHVSDAATPGAAAATDDARLQAAQPLRCCEATADSSMMRGAARPLARAARRLSTSCEGKAYAGAMTKVVCTLGPATETQERVQELCDAGMACARLILVM